MKIELLKCAIKIETRRHYIFLSLNNFSWEHIYFLPSLSLDTHYSTGN